ncbi:MAG TPA: polyprenyl synthetase family protein [Propionibacteriaceae bacterium]
MVTPTVDTLSYSWELIQPSLRSALDRLDPGVRHLCGYHLGFWDEQGEPDRPRGKGVRGVLALLSAQAAGSPVEVGLPAAAAVELVHNFSLLHDDLMDGDRTRRHRPTVWAVFGSGQAILAGDALLGLADEVLAEAPSANRSWAIRCLAASTRRLIAGQLADLAFETRRDVTLSECLQMAADKTAALLSCAASIGAVLANTPADLTLRLAQFGEHLGVAYQLIDDILGIWGSPEATGKPVLSDLRAKKKSLPVVAALTSSTAAGERLAALYLTDAQLTDAQLAEAADLVQQAGGRAWAENTADAELATALELIRSDEIPFDVAEELRRLAIRLSGRDR